MIFIRGDSTTTVTTQFRDPVGTGLAVLVGVLLGVTFSAPMLPREFPLVGMEVTLTPLAAYLLVSALVVVAIPVGVFVLYFTFARLE
jgi:hypothetical protein